MRVPNPINPQTRAPTQQVGYQQAANYSTRGLDQIGAAISRYGAIEEDREKERQKFDVSKKVLDEANELQTDFEQRTQDADLGAPQFVQRTMQDYADRHIGVLQDFKTRGYSEDSLNELELRLMSIRQHYLGQAIQFKEHADVAKADNDTLNLGDSGSRYAYNNPEGTPSVLAEGEAAINAMPTDEESKAKLKQRYKQQVLNSAAQGYATKYPEDVMRALAPNELQLYQSPQIAEPPTAAPNTMQSVVTRIADEFHLPPEQVAGVVSYETSGTFDPTLMGGTGGNYMGLIQFGKEERKKYLPKGKDSSPEDWAKGISSYLHDRGFKPGMSLLDFYSTINAGRPGRPNASDGNGTVSQHVQRILDKHVTIGKNWLTEAQPAVETVVGAPAMPEGPKPIIPGNLPEEIRYKVKNADGSISTVRTISVGTDKGEVVIPTVIDGKVVSNDEAIAHYKETGENFGTFATVADAEAYAQQLHNEHASKLGVEGNPILNLLDGQQQAQALGIARSELAHRAEVARQAEAAARADARQVHNDKLNLLYNGLVDDRLGQVDINNAYHSGLLADYDERKKAQDILDSKNKDKQALVDFGNMWNTGGKFNPYDDRLVKAADAGYTAMLKDAADHGKTDVTPPVAAMTIWQRTGILPKAGGVIIRGSLISTNPLQVAAAASVASNMLKQDPNAFAGTEGGKEIGESAAAYAHYVDDLGMTAEDAANKIALMNAPEAKAKLKADTPERQKFIKDINGTNIESVLNTAIQGQHSLLNPINWFFGPSSGSFVSEPQKAEASQTFLELATDHYDRYHDVGAAKAYATGQMGRFYGIEGGRLMKYPPAKAYPEVNGSRDYILSQAKGYVDQYAGFAVPVEDIFLEPTASGSTANAFRAGKQVPYELHFITRKNGQPIYHVVPGQVFTADVGEAQRDAAEKARKYSQQVRQRVQDTTEAMRNPLLYQPVQ